MIVLSVLFVVVVTIVIATKIVVEDYKWSAIRTVLKEPIGSGEFSFTKDCPPVVLDGKKYDTTFFKDLHKDLRGYRFAFYLVHDEDDFRSVEFGPQDVEASGLDELTYIKKTVYNL